MAANTLHRLTILHNLLTRPQPAGNANAILSTLRRHHDIEISDRTLKRDIEALKNLGVDITYDRKKKSYVKVDSGFSSSMEVFFQQVEVFEIARTFSISGDLKPYIGFDHIPIASRVDYIKVLLNAIRERVSVELKYVKYGDRESYRVQIEPYYLQEYDRVWYVHAKRTKDNAWRTYGLDRIQELILLPEQTFRREPVNIEEKFRSYIGVNGSGEKIDLEVLFKPNMGQFIKRNKLHPNQRVIRDDEDGVLIGLQTRVNNELYLTLMKYARHMTIQAPESLREEFADMVKEILERYRT